MRMHFMKVRLQDLPKQDLPRERLLELGAAALTNAELLALFINTGSKDESALQMAQRLSQEFKSLRHLSNRNAKELQRQFKGLGPAKACLITAAFELGRRAQQEQILEKPLNSPQLIYDYLQADMLRLSHETVRILLLNTRLHLIHDEVIFQGSLNESTAHPREILRPAIVQRAYAFILAHNHPSGDPSPSDSDRKFTKRLQQAAEILLIHFTDHIIIGAPRDYARPYFSFKEHGLL